MSGETAEADGEGCVAVLNLQFFGCLCRTDDTAGTPSSPSISGEGTDYERKRAANLLENARALEALGLKVTSEVALYGSDKDWTGREGL